MKDGVKNEKPRVPKSDHFCGVCVAAEDNKAPLGERKSWTSVTVLQYSEGMSWVSTVSSAINDSCFLCVELKLSFHSSLRQYLPVFILMVYTDSVLVGIIWSNILAP